MKVKGESEKPGLKHNNKKTNERLLLNHKRYWEEFNLEPEVRLDYSELLCNNVLLKYKRDRESF